MGTYTVCRIYFFVFVYKLYIQIVVYCLNEKPAHEILVLVIIGPGRDNPVLILTNLLSYRD